MVGEQEGSSQRAEGLVVDRRELVDGASTQVPGDQIAAESVGDTDEVTPRRVERVDETARVADHQPTLAAVHLLGVVGKVFEGPEIHLLVGVGTHGLGALGFVAVEPCQRGVERV